ncbi:MAG: fibronectin type III domain-containing protein [Candidatus Saccharimonadales bacterium]
MATTVKGTDCTGKGRRLTAGGNGCARHWIQSASHYDGAPQCSGNSLSGGPDTYYVVSGVDYCKATPAPPPPPPPPAPKVTLTASPTSVVKGTASKLTWSSQNATSCTASGSWSGAKAVSGSVSTGALSANSTYSLSCSGAGGTAKATAAVTVTTPATPPPTGGSGSPTPTPPSGSTGGSTPSPSTHTGSSTSTSGSNSSSSNSSANSNASPTDASKLPGVDTSVRTGTLSADAAVSADGATSVYISYGATADTLTNSTDTITFTSDPMDIGLSNLQAKTTYYYQVIRTDSAGTATTSSVDSFTTGGYGITLHFVDASGKALANIAGLINDDSSTITKSDKNGDLKFYDLDSGSYTVKYAYNKLTYTKDFDTSDATDDGTNSGQVAVLSDTINVSKLKNGSAQPLPTKKHSSVGTILLLLFFIFLVGGIIVWLVLRRRAQDSLYGTYGYAQKSAPMPVIDVPATAAPAMPLPPKVSPRAPKPEDTDNLEHVGESLREMVIRSMHEEAQKRKQGPPGPAT